MKNYASIFAYVAFFLYELAAWSYIVSHQHGEDISTLAALSIVTCFRIRVSGFIVVSHSCSGFISPKPLYRCVWIPFLVRHHIFE